MAPIARPIPRPFIQYYGAKFRIAPKYPAPLHGKIIEPFAGAANYSLLYPDRDVHLWDLDPIVCGVWDFLICASADDCPPGGVDEMRIPQEAKWLVGFWINCASAPRKKPSRWMRENPGASRFWGDQIRNHIADHVHLIRHWKIHHGHYSSAPIGEHTYFIDPPYERAGVHYRFGSHSIDLGNWCKSLPGQVIVCESADSGWLPFSPLCPNKSTYGQKVKMEGVWTN